jgi:hypothetical protein
MVFSINEDHGFLYTRRYSADEIAADIVAYVLERRTAPVQNVIYHTSELMNLDSITAEVYYGPQPSIPPGEELETDEGFALRRDEFGDLVAEYLYMDEFMAEQREEEKRMLEELQEQFGRYASFPGLGRLNSDPLTRGLPEPAIEYDEETGQEYVVEPTMPMGLKDIFTTFSDADNSKAKININTAPVPVLYALLPSLSEGPEGEAHFVAFAIRDYRNNFQEEIDEEGVERVEGESMTPDLGQPRRQLRTEEEEEAMTSLDPLSLQTMDMAALEGVDLEALEGGQDLETNYFTNLQQLELIDGVDEGPDDLLRRTEGVDRVSAEGDTLFQRVLNDYSKVMVFNSTYFSVELKAKTENNPLVKTGLLILKRDYQARLMDVILWKELQK